jgi:N-acetylmuramoyl-L-alanine amidase
MAIKTSLNYSPNFNPKRRKANQINFLIFHYTGMRTEKAAIKRLTEL